LITEQKNTAKATNNKHHVFPSLCYCPSKCMMHIFYRLGALPGPTIYLLSTRADRQGADISFTVCWFAFFVILCVCTVTDFSDENKASGIKFCSAVHLRPRQGITCFGEPCSHKSPKSDESASACSAATG